MTAKTQAVDSNGNVIQNVMRPTTTQKIAAGGSTTVYANGDVVRVVMDGNGWMLIDTGTGIVADNGLYMPSGAIEYVKMEGTNLYIHGSAQNLYATLMV